MGKIFGISNLPVSTIDKALLQQGIEKPVLKSTRVTKLNYPKTTKADAFVKTSTRKPSTT